MTAKKAARGRPKGSGNEAITHGALRAAEYGKLLAAGVRPATAARRVADNWSVAESTVYTDYQRHTISEEDLVNSGLAIWQLIDGFFDTLTDELLNAIEGINDEATIRAKLSEIVESNLEKIGDKAPHVTRPSTVGGAFRNGLKRKFAKD